MANALYGLAREAFLGGDLDWDSDWRIILVDDADYTINLTTHDFLDDVPGGARVATSGAMGSKTKTLGTADAADVTLTTVTGDPSERIVGYQHTGTEGTSRLGFSIDTATGLPVTPNGGNINVNWNASGIFTL